MIYESPIIIQSEECSEGLFMASGEDTPGSKTCNSVYMKGTYKLPNFSNWPSGKILDLGCHNCPANWGWCAVNSPYFTLSGPYMPSWEKSGFAPTDYWKDHNIL